MPGVEHFGLPITNSLQHGDLDECLRTGEIRLAVGPLVFIVEADLIEIHGRDVVRSTVKGRIDSERAFKYPAIEQEVLTGDVAGLVAA